MVKRFLHHLSPVLWTKSLAVYTNSRLWQEVRQQAVQSRWAEVGAAIAFLWLLGLLGLSFVLLHVNQTRSLPSSILDPARALQTALAIAEPAPSSSDLGLWGLGIVGLGAWVCLVTGTQKLMQLVAAVYNSDSPAADWRRRLMPWVLTLLGLGITSLVFISMGSDRNGVQPSLAQWLGWLSRLTLTLGSVALGLGLAYRLIPRRWIPGQPLWPGVRIALVFGLGLLGLRRWGVSLLERSDVAYGLLLSLSINLLALYLLILLVPAGAQINLSTLRYRGMPRRPWRTPVATPPPPSFDSFKIKRRD